MWGPAIKIGIVSVPAAMLAELAGLPAAWLVAPMIVALLFSIRLGQKVAIPAIVFTAAQAILGMTLSASVGPSSLALPAGYWWPVSVALVVALAISIVSGLLLSRFGGLDAATASLGTLPGGASGMVSMSDDMDADARLVAFMQYVRLVIVILLASVVAHLVGSVTGGGAGAPSTPAPNGGDAAHTWFAYGLTAIATVLGSWAGARLPIPAGAFMGPLLVGVALGVLDIPHGAWPPGVLYAAFLLMGVGIGGRFDSESMLQVRRAAPSVIAQVLLVIAACALLAWGLAAVTGMDVLTAYLATTPGGIESVTVAALDSGADTTVVLAVQLVRLLLVVIVGPPLVRWLSSRRESGTAGNPEVSLRAERAAPLPSTRP